MIPLSHSIFLSSVLFTIGLTGIIVRKNFFFILLGLEIMINASALAFVSAGSFWGQSEGQVMYIFIITLAASEASIGLALLLQLYKQYLTLNIDKISENRK